MVAIAHYMDMTSMKNVWDSLYHKEISVFRRQHRFATVQGR
jgi:hypothetical protein